MCVCLLSIVCKTTASGSQRKGLVSVEVRGGGIGKSIQDFHFQVNKTAVFMSYNRLVPIRKYISTQTYSSTHMRYNPDSYYCMFIITIIVLL